MMFNTQSKSVLKQIKNSRLQMTLCVLEFFVKSTGSRHLREMKTSTNAAKLAKYKAPFNFSEMVNGPFKHSIVY